MIELDDVTLSFGEVSVLDGIDLRIEPGEFVAVVGPNGAGKTTLLRAINGIIDPDAGVVRLDGTPLAAMSTRDVSRTLATVPQDTHVGFSFTAEQIVEMGRTPHRSRLDWSDDDDPVTDAMERTETTHLRDRQVADLSGGERQRVLLARALAQEPEGLLLDEPTASLDINHQIQVLDLVADLVDEGRGALAAIHDLDLAARYCDRVLLLHDGEIRARGRPETVLRDAQLETAFETETAVTQNPVTGSPTVTAVETRDSRDDHVHVAGGGHSAVVAVRALWQAGFEVSVGPVPDGDVTAELARHLDVAIVTTPPLQAPTQSALDTSTSMAESADIVLTTPQGGDGITDSVGDTPTVETALAESGRGATRVDGGNTAAVETVEDLLETVVSATET
jgi:iron complex transport system ATP-binding protein